MDKINGQKLLPSSKALTVSQKKLSSSQLVPYKNIKQSVSEKIKKEDKKVTPRKETLLGNVITIKRTVLKIEKLLGNRNTMVLKEKKNIDREDRDKKRKEREEKLEQKKESKNLDGKTPNIPGVGIVDYIKNFLKWVIIGRAFMLFSKFIPNIVSFAKRFKFVYDIFKTITGIVFDGLVTFIEWTDKAGKKVREIAGALGGEPFQKAFDNFSGALTTFMNLALIAGMATMGGSDLGVGNALDDISPDKPGKTPSRRKPGSPRITQGKGGRPGRIPKIKNPFRNIPKLTGRLPGRPKLTGSVPDRPQLPGSAAKPSGLSGAKLGAKTLLKSLRPLLRGMVIGGLIDFGLSVALGENPGRAAFGAVGATLLGVIGGALGGPFAAFTAIGGGMLGDWAGRKLYDVFFGNQLPSKSKPQKKNAGGSIKPKTGQPVKTKRSIPQRNAIKPPTKGTVKKGQPGKDVGGQKSIQKLFPDPSRKLSVSEWNMLGYAGTYADYEQEYERQKNKPNPFKALTKVSETVATAPLIGRLLQAPINAALGEKPDKLAFKSFSDSISYITNVLSTNKVNEAVSLIRNNIKVFAEGGEIPTRELVSTRNKSSDYGELFESIFGKDIENSFNKSLDAIKKEVDKRTRDGVVNPNDPNDPDNPQGETTPGARLRDGSNAEIEADLLEYFTALYGKNAAIGIVANLRRESGYRTKTPDNKLYEGMAQWSRNERWPRFVKWAESKGMDPYSRNAQAQYIAVELKQLGTDNRLKKSKTPEEAASLFYNEFERGSESKPVKGSQYNPDNIHENLNKEFIQDISKRNPDIGKRADKVVIRPSVSEAMVTGGLKPSEIPVTSRQGWRWGKMHKGIDMDGGDGAPISSAQDAQVVFAGDTGGGYGNEVVLRYSNGAETRFAHLKSLGVTTGQSIKAGQLIGKQGSTGSSTASHLHFEYYPNGGARTYEGYGDAFSVKDSYFRYGGNVKPKVSAKPLSSEPLSPEQRNSIQNALVKKGQIPLTVNGQNYILEAVPNSPGSVRVFKPKNLLGYREEIDLTGGKNKFILDAAKQKINTMYPILQKQSSNEGGPTSPTYGGGGMQGGGYLNMNYKNISRPSMINDYDPLDDSEPMIYIQPVIIREQIPVAQKNSMSFPGNTTLNSISAKSTSLSR